jgi:hypothetical protein
MLRLRLASLALASGLMLMLSGCNTCSEDGRMFPRLFGTTSMRPAGSYGLPGECECHGAHSMPPVMDSASMPGPMWPVQSGPNASQIPITNVPANQPPQMFPVPQARPVPYNPAH